MTTVMGIHVEGKAWIAADRRVTGGASCLFPSQVSKIETRRRSDVIFGRAIRQDMAFAPTGGHAGCLIAREAFKSVPFDVSALEACQIIRRAAIEIFDQKQDYDICGILVWRGKMYDVDTKGAPSPINANVLWARGSGEDYAIGAGSIISESAKEQDKEIEIPAMLNMVYETVIKYDIRTGDGLNIVELILDD